MKHASQHDRRRRPLLATLVLTLALGAVFGTALGQKVLNVATRLDIANVDLHLTTNYDDRLPLLNVLEFLIGIDENGAPAPVLAEDWVWSDDGMTLTVNLRQGVMFHNGNEMTSEDVKYSLDRVRTEGPRSSEFGQVSDIVAADRYTVEIVLSEPTAALLGALANPIAPAVIIPAGEAERQGGTITAPVGTGPFRFVEWLPDQYLRVAKFEDYALDDRPASGFTGRREALVDEVVFRPITEATVRAAALENGEVHIADSLAYPDYARLQDHADVIVEMIPSATFGDVRFGFKQGAFANDLNLRLAVAMVTNKDDLVEALTWGQGRVAHSGLPYFSPYAVGIHQEPEPYDVERARELVQASNYDGSEILISYTPGIWREMAVIMQAQMAEIGIDSRVDSLEPGSSLQKWQTGAFDVFVTGLSLRPDPMNYYMPFWHSASTTTGYTNADYDRLNEEALAETDIPARTALYEEIEALRRADMPWYPLIHTTETKGYSRAITGFQPWSAGYMPIWNVDIP
ncbi:MAG: ABC transporter substrate-binding protein [Trueperaceae bacterium]